MIKPASATLTFSDRHQSKNHLTMSCCYLFSLSAFLLLLHSSQASATTTLFSPITKDNTTNLYTLLIYLKTPLQPSTLHLDLGSYLPFYDCARHYKSSSYHPVFSNSTLCTDLNPGVFSNCFSKPGPGCFNDSCGFFPENPVTWKIASGELLQDKLALPATASPNSNSKPGPGMGPVYEFVFSCTDPNKYSRIYRGLAKGSAGVAALGRFKYSLPAQLSRAASSPEVFAVCLPGSSKSPGLALFNSPGPYNFSPGIDVSTLLTYTPLILGPRGVDTRIYYWYKSPDYNIGLTSIQVNRRGLNLNKTLLAIDDIGRGGTKLSTSAPYSVLQTSIFNALVDAFVEESANLTRIAAVDPFRACFAAAGVGSTRLGPDVPRIDLVMQNGGGAIWRIYGSNSMVKVRSGGVEGWCLGFVDGGGSPRTSVVIGGLQMENNLLQFDLERQRLGFTSSLLGHGTSCSNSNLTLSQERIKG